MSQPMTQEALDEALKKFTMNDQSLAELYLQQKVANQHAEQKRAKEIHERMQQLMNQAQNVAAMNQQGLQGFAGKSFAPPIKTPPAADWVQPFTPPPLDEESARADEAQQAGLAAMNPIARTRYEPIIKLLGIKVRFTVTAGRMVDSKQWILARMGKDGRMIRQEWTAPSRDPGCSLLTWQAMIGEFLDEVARRDGTEIPTDTDKHNRAENTGSEAASSAGNS